MEKKAYRVRDGVEWINGKPVPSNRIVELSQNEARYERSLGRLAPVARRRRRARKSAT